ncbi:unnamed protein product [Clonostachys byssicola]|uniref:Uncharacterized protein n=1 Tax=Clonostachys byssicola TaxID=160290 RepID=A0A9N9U932_9HYPO|nr:unnamed protein product [Clonostachys byssicola]
MSQGDDLRQLELELRRGGNPLSNYFRHTRMKRGNTPSQATRHVGPTRRIPVGGRAELWIVDRILEPQTLAHFLACVCGSPLPNGQQSKFPVLSVDEAQCITQPLSEWAPPPYDGSQHSVMDKIAICIGSYEDESNLTILSKELRPIKALVWAGMTPISERRWRELDLDSPGNFHNACRYFCAVIDVFHYLNMPAVKPRLRKTYNAIWDQLKIFEYSLNNNRRAKGEPKVNVTGMWYEYIDALFASISQHAHDWVTTHIERLRGPVLQRLNDIVKSKSVLAGEPEFSQEEMDLSNKLHDLVENAAQADTAIFLPMDGYRGCELVSQDNVPLPDAKNPYREQPISFSANKRARELDYYARLKYLTTYQKWKEFDNTELASLVDRLDLVSKGDSLSVNQVIAQHQARMELRGPTKSSFDELWVIESQRQGGNKRWGFLAYRLCYDHTDEEWEEFKAKFESDVSNWRNEMPDMDNIKARSVVEWRDPRTVGLPENDVDAVRKHFASLEQFNLIPEHVNMGVILAADKAVIDSYLKPSPGQGGFVLAIEAGFDPNDEWRKQRNESPGYPGILKILGSVLWDDVSASMLLQARRLDDLWVLAMDHPLKLYEGYMPRHAPV